MNIEAVRKLTRKKIISLGLSDRAYAKSVGVTQNNLYLFMSGKGAYKETVPKAILKDLGLIAETFTSYKPIK